MYPYTYPEFNLAYRSSLKEAVDLIKQIIQNEYNDIKIYESIYKSLQDIEQKELMNSIIKDETDHLNVMKNLYEEITGNSILPKELGVSVPDKTGDALKKSVLGETRTVNAYNKLYASIQEMRYRNVLQKIINDELKHQGLFNYLLICNMP
jgi:rubrerythrin